MNSLATRSKGQIAKQQATSLTISTGVGIGMYLISFWAFLLYLAYQGARLVRDLRN